MPYYTFVGSRFPQVDWTEEIVLETNDQGEPSSVLRKGQAANLEKEQVERLEGQYILEQTTKEEAEKQQAGSQRDALALPRVGEGSVLDAPTGVVPAKQDQKSNVDQAGGDATPPSQRSGRDQS